MVVEVAGRRIDEAEATRHARNMEVGGWNCCCFVMHFPKGRRKPGTMCTGHG